MRFPVQPVPGVGTDVPVGEYRAMPSDDESGVVPAVSIQRESTGVHRIQFIQPADDHPGSTHPPASGASAAHGGEDP